VDFKTSCAPNLRQTFNRAVALLHSFEYDSARAAFTEIAARDPQCAMAHWGSAMTYFHGAWGEVDHENGAREASLGHRISGENGATSTREKQFIAAVLALYADPNATVLERARAFSAVMAAMHAASPRDDEIAIFYALSLFESAGRDQSYANQRKCGAILEPLFEKLPTHPGVAHYLIHCYDNPALALNGVRAAREYAKIAPDSAHATHMPSHIFVRLGLWQDTVQSNLNSMDVAAHEPGSCHGRDAQLHAMHFLQFAYLQLGLQAEAKAVAESALALPNLEHCPSGEYVAASYVLHAHDWALAERLTSQFDPEDLPDSELILTAIGIAAARTGDLNTAQRAARDLATLRDTALKKIAGGANSPFEAARLEVQSWIAQMQGEPAKALEHIRRADEIGGYASWVQPIPSEHLGDLLLEQNQPAAALSAYRKALDNTPHLFNALYGAARAADAAGDAATASSYYKMIIEVAGNGNRNEVESAKRKLDAASIPTR
jgi:tetratricopeptide (TPR) repeat protein